MNFERANMTAKARLGFTQAARVDLKEMRRYGFEQFGREIADRYVDDIEGVFRLLQEQPRAGQARPEIGSDIRCFSKKQHRVFYRVENDSVVILRVIHHAMDAKRALKRTAG